MPWISNRSTFSTQTFDDLMQEKDWVQFWSAREIAPLFGYVLWQNFKKLVEKAKNSIKSTWEEVTLHIIDINKTQITPTGGEIVREWYDFLLTRYACYLIAQNGDPTKKEIAMCQQYFWVRKYCRKAAWPITSYLSILCSLF